MAAVGSMANISKALHVSKSSALAANLAQEKIEFLKNLSYYRLLVTTNTAAAAEPGLGGFLYDTGNYAPEPLTVGQIKFERRVLIQKLGESGGNLSTLNWWDDDTGLKQITSYVIWNDNRVWKKYVVTNLRDNPNRKKLSSTFSITVKSGGIGLSNITVFALEDPLLNGVTDGSGSTSIKVASGTYTLRANSRAYFSMDISSSVADAAVQPVVFNLTAKGSGFVAGTAYLDTHLVISEVCAAASASDDNLEYIEIYNPTSVNGISVTNYLINYTRTSDGATNVINPPATTRYVNSTIPSRGYFLIASSPVVNGITADAYYSDSGRIKSIPANRLPINESGGAALVAQAGAFETAQSTVDAIGWGKSSGSPYGPSNAREGAGLRLNASSSDGLQNQQTIQRMVYSTSTAVTMSLPGGSHAFLGTGYDSNNNQNDWVYHNDLVNDFPRNTAILQSPQTGTPASGANVFMDDKLSGSVLAQGGASPGIFSVPSVATGTWSLLVSSKGWVHSRDSTVVVTNAATTYLDLVLISSPASGGYVSGRVADNSNMPIIGITVVAPGGSDVTDSNGYYRFLLSADTYTVVANGPDPATHLIKYTEGDSTSVAVNLGLETAVPDLVLFQGGVLSGWITPNGTDPLPGIPVTATSTATGLEVGTAVSNSLGKFSFPDLPVGSYSITPQLEPGESSNPASRTGTVVSAGTVFVGTFTVSNAFGTIGGNLKSNSAAITTGVLVAAVAQPATITSIPPLINAALRTGPTAYYMSSSDAQGNYSIAARGGTTYNIYAWYTTYNGTTPSIHPQNSTAALAAGGSATVNFSW